MRQDLLMRFEQYYIFGIFKFKTEIDITGHIHYPKFDEMFIFWIIKSPILNPFTAKKRRRSALASCEKCQRCDTAPFDSSLLSWINCQDDIYDDGWYAAVRKEVQ
ncbi:hypothetical protein RF11_07597 [Thelohanellus kitauei]|uniref:Uncharacterized protein n=1 Tax=Thelohanellus kitauei TaxID=669202 RepID=A0A0C2JFL3_THEKT|nr:hypothetical protein RF11_07597 [Thelohanellus kitauei]